MGRAELERAAQELANQGRSIFPAVPGGKTPAVPWKRYQHQRATTAQIRTWWQQQPYNVAVVCGPISNLLVVDVDTRHGGMDSIGYLELPETATVATPGGLHYWFAWPHGAAVRSSTSRIAAGIDVRAAGAYVIAPPSSRPDGTYAWFLDAVVEEPPASLLELAMPADCHLVTLSTTTGRKSLHSGRWGRNYLDSALQGILADLAAAKPGSRNNTLFRSACRVAELVDQGAPEQWLQQLAETGRRIGLPPAEVAATIASARARWRPR